MIDLDAIRKIAAAPLGSFSEQFPNGCDGYIRTKMEEAGWIYYEGRHPQGGYRLTDHGKSMVTA
jgi:hypothetical protein